jgi:putative FmdB family regulatory protein
MPIYEYVCTKCSRRCEVLQRLSDPLLKECRVCGGALKKIVSPAAIQFKGTGWYITDYTHKSSPDWAEQKKETHAEGKNESGKDTSEKKKPASEPAKD